MRTPVKIDKLTIDENGPFFLIAGPCVIEDEETTLETAHFLKKVGEELLIPVIFKTSYDKANRTSVSSFRGPGIDKGLEIIGKVKCTTKLPVLSDVHTVEEIQKAKEILDIIQIPAFLCRQTDLVLAAARTGLPINIKKGQFLSPWDVEHVVSKITSTDNYGIIVTERGTSFGYNNLVVDIRSIAIMKNMGFPVVYDATHSVQLPGGQGVCSGGQREFIGPLSRAAVAAGADGVFMEVHPDPERALCDGPNALPLHEVRDLLIMLKKIFDLIHT